MLRSCFPWGTPEICAELYSPGVFIPVRRGLFQQPDKKKGRLRGYKPEVKRGHSGNNGPV
eukprot:14710064-Heterocapsa_arctica.AAC.1